MAEASKNTSNHLIDIWRPAGRFSFVDGINRYGRMPRHHLGYPVNAERGAAVRRTAVVKGRTTGDR